MSEGRVVGRAAEWLGTKAVDGARVGPFELVTCDREGAQADTFDVYVDGFDEPLAFGVFAADADSLTLTRSKRMLSARFSPNRPWR